MIPIAKYNCVILNILLQFIEAAAKGFHIVEHSNCDNCENEEAWSWLRGSGRSTPKKMCWTMDVTTHFGTYSLPYNCKYSQISNEECELDTSKSNIKDKLQSKCSSIQDIRSYARAG